MRLPEVEARLSQIASEIAELSRHIARRSPMKRAPRASAKVTAELRRQIREFAKTHPDWTQLRIGQKFNVNQGRVSEAMRGKRK